ELAELIGILCAKAVLGVHDNPVDLIGLDGPEHLLELDPLTGKVAGTNILVPGIDLQSALLKPANNGLVLGFIILHVSRDTKVGHAPIAGWLLHHDEVPARSAAACEIVRLGEPVTGPT